MQTKARIARLLGVSSLAEVEAAINGLMGVPAITPDLSPFDWLKPHASFLVRMRVSYCLYTVTNADNRITMYLAVPQRVRLHLSIEHFCDLDAFETAVETGEATVDQDLTVPPANDLNKRLRLMYLRALLEWLHAPLELVPPLTESAADAAKRRMVEAEIAELGGN